MTQALTGRWRATSLRQRLTVFYTALFFVLLSAVAYMAQQLMHQDLLRSLEADLADTYSQFTLLGPDLALQLGGSDAAASDPAAPDLRSRFPSSVIQVDPLVFKSAASDLTAEWDAARASGAEVQLLDFLRKQSDALRPRPVGIDPQSPIKLSDAELARLIESPSGQILLNKPVKPQFSEPENMRLLVTLAPLDLRTGPAEPPERILAITYVGRSLADINRTITRMKLLMSALLLSGLFLSAAGAYWLAGVALRPLGNVRSAVENINSENLTARVPVPTSNDEVGALANEFNGMLERLEDSFEMQRRFTSDASHELRTPVTAISGHATYLLRRTSLDAQQRESIEIIQREAGRMTELISSLLQLARSDGGVMKLNPQPVFAQMFFGEVARELRPLAAAEQAELSVGGEEVVFEADPDRLRQVVNNLISNALKAGASRIDLLSSQPRPGWVRLTVQDNGPGIAAEQLEKLFDRFYRLEDSRSRDRGGAGLGLAIARTIVERHGGRIWLESELGTGTRAQVELPVGDIPAFDDEDIP